MSSFIVIPNNDEIKEQFVKRTHLPQVIIELIINYSTPEIIEFKVIDKYGEEFFTQEIKIYGIIHSYIERYCNGKSEQ